MFKIYYDIPNNMCVVADRDYSSGDFVLSKTSDNKVILEKDGTRIVDCVPLTNIVDASGNQYPDYTTFRGAIKSFFVKASSSSGGEAGNVNGGDAFSSYN